MTAKKVKLIHSVKKNQVLNKNVKPVKSLMWKKDFICFKWSIPGPSFLCFSTVYRKFVHYKIMLMTGFELRTSAIGSNPSTDYLSHNPCSRWIMYLGPFPVSLRLILRLSYLQLTLIKILDKITLFSGFETGSSGIGSDHSANWATTMCMSKEILQTRLQC